METTNEASLGSETWSILALGLASAVLAASVGFLDRTLACLTTLIHELGHCLVGFLYGYPSLPAFDFRYGGGVTMHRSRHAFLLLAVYGLLAMSLYLLRRNPRGLAVMATATGLYALTAHSSAHKILILFAGHGGELLLAVVFLLRAMSDSATERYVERPLYAACGLYIVLKDSFFAWALMTDVAARARYGAAKGGGHWMDFSRIAAQLGSSVESVATFFLLCCLATPLLALLLHRYRQPLLDLAHETLATDEAEDVI